MAIENPSVLYLEQSLSPEQKTVVCENIGAVRTIAGKGLSTEDFTTAEKNKLSDVESGAEENTIEIITVNSESTTISNKTVNIPAATASTSGAGGTSGVMTPSDKEKLDGLVSNVQSDWNAASGSAAEILNKPTIPTVDQTYDGTSTNAQSGVAVASAISGLSFDEVPTVTSNDDGKVLKASYSGGAGSYSWDTDSGEANAIEAITVNSESTTISSKTVNIPAATASTSGVGGTSGVMTPSDKEKLDGLVSNVQSDWNAASGSAAEILNKPTIPSVDQTYSSSSTNAQSGVAVASAISGIADVPQVGSGDDGKVLKASYSGGAGSYSWQPESGGGGTTYTAGDGIDITSGAISADIDTDAGLIFDSSSKKIQVNAGTNIGFNSSTGALDVPTVVASVSGVGGTDGVMIAADKEKLDSAVTYTDNTITGEDDMLAQQMVVVTSDNDIMSFVQGGHCNGLGTIFFRVTGR